VDSLVLIKTLKDGAQSLGGDCQGGSGSEDGAMVEMKQRPT